MSAWRRYFRPVLVLLGGWALALAVLLHAEMPCGWSPCG